MSWYRHWRHGDFDDEEQKATDAFADSAAAKASVAPDAGNEVSNAGMEAPRD
jgi:hypothetical protein